MLVDLIKMGNLSYDDNTKLVTREAFPVDTGSSSSFGPYACPTLLLTCQHLLHNDDQYSTVGAKRGDDNFKYWCQNEKTRA